MARPVSDFSNNFQRWLHVTMALLLWFAMSLAHAAAENYSWPADLAGSPFNCTETSPSVYSCPAISFSKNTSVAVTEPIKVIVNGDFYAFMADIGTSGKALLLDVQGSVTFAQNSSGYLDIKATGDINIGMNSGIHGDLASTGGNVNVDKNSTIYGNVDANDALYVGKHGKITGTCTYKSTNYTCAGTPVPNFDHFMVEHEGTGLTCIPSPVTIWACAGASGGGTCATTSLGASGTLLVKSTSGASVASYPFSIPAGDTSITINVPYAGTKTVVFGTDTAGTTCWDGDSASCQHVYNDAGFDFEVQNLVSATTQLIDIYAVRKAQGSNTCAPAFSGTKAVNFSCTYVDPSSAAPLVVGDEANTGSRPVVISSGGISKDLLCGSSGQTIDLNFDTAGKAQFNISYADAGKIQLVANYFSAAMVGSSSFTAYPRKFEVTWPNPSATVVAGADFRVKVTALNDANNTTPNYGRENTRQSAVLSFIRCKPVNGDDGIASGTLGDFDRGSAESANSKWGEVGTIDVKATNASYLGLGLAIEGSSDLDSDPAPGKCTGRFGRFRPSYFKTALTDPTRAWAYSGEPFGVLVSGFNAQNVATRNYNKINDLEGAISLGFVSDITFTALGVAPDPVIANPGPGSVTPVKVEAKDLADYTDAAGALLEGTVEGKTGYTFTSANLPVKPTKIAVCATDNDNVSSTGHCDAVIEIRTGRLRMSNAFGSVNANLQIPVRAEYWTGSSWLLNTQDSFTVLPVTAIALSPAPQVQGVTVLGTNVAFTSGAGRFTLAKPARSAGYNGVGFVNIAANLGNTSTDASCLATKPVTIGANISWLRSRNGSCNATWAQDPAARANFGVTTPENNATIHVRESFN